MVRTRKFQLGVNPIIVKELRSRMRGVRAFATLTGILLLLSVISYLLFRIVIAGAQYSNTPVSPLIGQTLFAGLSFLLLMMVCGITPAVTASALSGEQEKLTYEMLMSTPLRPASILWGKLVSALSYIFLLLFAAIPLSSLVFLFGGVALRDMAKSLILLVAVAVMFGVVGLFFSALMGRTGRATVASYLVVLAMLFGPTFVAFAVQIWTQAEAPRWILVSSPLTALFSAISPSIMGGDMYGGNPFLSFYYMFGGVWGGFSPVSSVGIPRPLYHYSLPLYGGITLVLYMLATILVLPVRRWRVSWKRWLLGLLLVVLYSGLVFLFFWRTSGTYGSYSIFARPTPAPVMPGGVMIEERAFPAVDLPAGVEPTAAPIQSP
jgi:ABC-2 type transport system permease protein